MDGFSDHDLNAYPCKKPRISYQDKVTNTARNRLSGALQVAITNKDDRDDDASSLDMSPIKRALGVGSSPFASPAKSPGKGVRRRKRHIPDKNSAFHHTFVMKLFDRSVDLAQFREGTPLYPVCRAWMKNEPTNTEQGPRHRTPTPGPDEEDEDLDDSEDEQDKSNSVFKLPPPSINAGDGKSPRIPPPPLQLIEGLDMDLDQTDAPPPNLLLSNHMVRWWGVKKSWKQASIENEARYSESMQILKDMFEK